MNERKTALIIIFIVLVILAFVSLLIITINKTYLEYCQSHGWDGVIHQGVYKVHCYNTIEHPSGTGTYDKLSGEISGEEINEWKKKT